MAWPQPQGMGMGQQRGVTPMHMGQGGMGGMGAPWMGMGQPGGGMGMGQPSGSTGMGQPIGGPGMGQPIGGPGMGQPIGGPGMGQPSGSTGMGQPYGGTGMGQPYGGTGMGQPYGGMGMGQPYGGMGMMWQPGGGSMQQGQMQQPIQQPMMGHGMNMMGQQQGMGMMGWQPGTGQDGMQMGGGGLSDAPPGSGCEGSSLEQSSDQKDDAPLQSEGPDLLDMTPTRIKFKPGAPNNKQKVKLECLSLKNVAYKVLIHKSSLEFYTVLPVKGVLSKGTNGEVTFELGSKHTEDELTKADPKCHRFHIQAQRWPPNVKEFDSDVWKQLEHTKKAEMQTIAVEVMLDVKDSEFRDKAASAKAGNDDLLAAVNPVKLNFKKRTTNVTIKSLGEYLAFKVMTNKPNVYNVNPSKGVLQSGKAETVEIEMKGTAKDGGKDVKFNVQTAAWPKAETKFDADVWKKLPPEHIQTVALTVDNK